MTWSSGCVIIYTNVADQVSTFTITETELYVLIVTLSTQDNAKLLPKLKSCSKRTISWNKYLSKPKLLPRKSKIDFLFSIWKCTKNKYKRYCIPEGEIKDYNVMIDGKSFFDKPVKNNKVTYENLRKIATGQGDDYTTGCLLDYIYFKNYYKMAVVDLSKQQTLDVDPKATQEINFIATLDRAGNIRFYFILEEVKETVFEFS